MVKKLLFTFSLFFLFNISNVFAYQLPTAYTGVSYVDDSYRDGDTTVASWWGSSNYLASPYRLGYFTSATAEAKQIQFLWENLNLCPNQNIKISGKIGALFNFFTENPYTVSIFNNNQQMTCSINLEDNSRIGYTCVGVGGGNFYIALTQLNFASHNNYEVGVSRDIEYSCEVTNLQVMQQEIINTQNIINSQNQNTQNIINNQNSNTNQIIQDNQQNTQDIINNQNQNTQQQIESQRVCSIINKNNVVSNGYLGSTGNINSSDTNGITDYLSTNDVTLQLITKRSSVNYMCFYDENKTLISCTNTTSLNLNTNIDFPTNSAYFRATIRLDEDKPQFNYCRNGNQALSDDLNNLNSSITSDVPPDTENQLNNLDSSLISDTPITDLITLPITLLNAYLTGFSGSCSPYNFGNLYGTNLIFPCINLQQRLGSNLWTIIDGLFSIYMIYNIAMLMIQAFEGFTSLRDDYEGLYQPRHADTGYQPKHGGGN